MKMFCVRDGWKRPRAGAGGGRRGKWGTRRKGIFTGATCHRSCLRPRRRTHTADTLARLRPLVRRPFYNSHTHTCARAHAYTQPQRAHVHTHTSTYSKRYICILFSIYTRYIHTPRQVVVVSKNVLYRTKRQHIYVYIHITQVQVFFMILPSLQTCHTTPRWLPFSPIKNIFRDHHIIYICMCDAVKIRVSVGLHATRSNNN